MNLPMNLNDIDLWEKELLKGFALPLGFLPEIGEVVNILEPFKRLTIFEPVEKDGETTKKKVTVGIIYRSDGLYAWDNSRAIPNEYDEAIKWSPASQLPEYAIRRKAIVTKNFISNKENHGFPLDKLGGRDYTMYIATK